MIRISKGLDIPLQGEPNQEIEEGHPVREVAVIGPDYIGMKPTMAVKEGDAVKLGQLLFTDKKTPGVRFTSPGCGRVKAINRGAKRFFQSLVIELDGDEEETFDSFYENDLSALSREQVRDNLVESGLWTAFRTRPYSKVPPPESAPHSIFVTAMDTNPLAPKAERVIVQNQAEFVYGLQVIRHLTEGPLFVCKSPGAPVPGGDLDFVTVEEFSGPHPAGLPGTHIHFLDPVSMNKTVWYLNYQDLIAIGRLFITGRLPVDRVISLAGPGVKKPRLIRTRMGACIDDLTRDELDEGEYRLISGSALTGRKSEDAYNFLGRYHLQISVLPEGRERTFLGWLRPGIAKHSVTRGFASGFFPDGQKFRLTTSTEGSRRAMVPIGTYEKVMPLDIIPTFLLRSLIVGDSDQAQALGCLELDEEDVALCTYVCPGKYEYGPILRENLLKIEKEG